MSIFLLGFLTGLVIFFIFCITFAFIYSWFEKRPKKDGSGWSYPQKSSLEILIAELKEGRRIKKIKKESENIWNDRSKTIPRKGQTPKEPPLKKNEGMIIHLKNGEDIQVLDQRINCERFEEIIKGLDDAKKDKVMVAKNGAADTAYAIRIEDISWIEQKLED
ncbi:hypothetical protein [Tetragenococcus halophilus]|uniref:Uncharacterized protein n=1 Tax=Tetragenococcus halophilus (strain DSM 20338 / JCM 20259 / NCIMB 9735 / NBRC 12172) TaxID=945021 RepID=A0AAN1SFQ9_TETHN|nr:hypothetical protein [Tetragenococcus halophilus]BAK94179.1 hypothetical protein TEH_08520 [Tetragenococcus halophilus NBRC 12172]GBD70773.1 putative uncharacterized protein [Tetragenococcus halophilus subsp. halophilus]